MKNINMAGIVVGFISWVFMMDEMFDGKGDVSGIMVLILGAGMLVPAYFIAIIASIFIGKKPD